jgi:hypothetical protein
VKFFLDENETVALLPPLREVFYQDEFRSSGEESLLGMDDVPLLKAIRARGFEAIITRDRVQLTADELDTLIGNNLHWIGHKPPPLNGVGAVAMLASAYLAALHWTLPILRNAKEPMKISVRNIPYQQEQRIATPVPLRTLRRSV